MKLVIDLSYYNNLSNAQWDLLATVLDGVIIRLSFGTTIDVMADDHIAQAKRVGLPYAGYHWVDPTKNMTTQIGLYVNAVRSFQPASMFNDYEQYWTDWAAYMKQDLVAAYNTRFTPKQLNDYYLKFHQQAKQWLDIPVGGYSADWFISKYAPDMGKWVASENYWEARYMRYYDADWWTAKQKELGRDFNIQHMKEIAAYARIFKGIGRQFESYAEVKGLYEGVRYHLDWNVFTDDGFSRMFGVAVDQQPEPEPDPEPEPLYKTFTVSAVAAWVRNRPNGTIVGYKMRGDKVVVLNTVEGWAQINYGWMALSTLSESGNSFRCGASFLWKRETPNGIKVGYLVKGQIVTIMEIVDGWGLIEGGGWVGMGYMEAV